MNPLNLYKKKLTTISTFEFRRLRGDIDSSIGSGHYWNFVTGRIRTAKPG